MSKCKHNVEISTDYCGQCDMENLAFAPPLEQPQRHDICSDEEFMRQLNANIVKKLQADNVSLTEANKMLVKLVDSLKSEVKSRGHVIDNQTETIKKYQDNTAYIAEQLQVL